MRWPWWLVVAGLCGAAVSMAGCTTGTPAVSRPSASATGMRTPVRPTGTASSAAGITAAWVRQENARPGSTGWRIPNNAPATIAGFASRTYAAAGQRVRFYVSTPAPRFHIQAYRMGYYGGAGARLVWHSARVPGYAQPPCPRTRGTNMVSCDSWQASTTITVSAKFVTGDYLFKLVSSDGAQSYVPLTVWNPSGHATYLIKNDVLTWQAWNPYGGYDYYTGKGSCPPGVYPLCSRARVVSFDRPYATGRGAGDFLGLGLPLVRLAEQHGLDVGYVTDLTVIQHPHLLARHRALLSLGHDECWGLRERLAVTAAEAHGLNLGFLGASAILRHVRVRPSPLGPDRQEVDYRDSHADPRYGHGHPRQVTGNTWGSPPASWPADMFVGEAYAGYLEPGRPAVPFTVADAHAWIFAGTGVHNGSRIPGVINSDVDGFNPNAHPNELQIFGHSPVPVAGSQTNRAFGSVYYSDMTYYTDPTGHAGVFDSGTNNWIPAMTPCPPGGGCPAAFVRRVTLNLLHLFGQGPAGLHQPSHANWTRMAPYH